MTKDNEPNVAMNPAEIAQMYDMFEHFLMTLEKSDIDFSVGMHALIRTVAYGGVILKEMDTMTKRQFVALAVERLSQHYDEIAATREAIQ
jgi:hypothetical protein